MTKPSVRYHQAMVPLGPRAHKLLTRPDPPPPIAITDRDQRLLDALARFRFCTSEMLARHVGGSLRGVRTRLYLLWANRFIDRPKSQLSTLESYYHNGAPPLIYGLARKGASYLADRGVSLAHRVDNTFRTGAAASLPHTLDTAATMLQFYTATDAVAGLQLIDHHELLPSFPDATQKRRSPFELAVTFDHDGKPTRIAVVPDRLFSLVTAAGRHNFTLELDRDTETVKPHKLSSQSTIYKKQLGLYHAFKQDLHRTTWGWARLRVLFITTTESHVETMLAAQREATQDGVHGMFLYTTKSRIAEHGVLGPAWKTARGDGLCLLPTTTPATSILEHT